MEAQYRKFPNMIRVIRINVPLVYVLARMPNYGKFLKELISNKHKIKQISAAFLSDESSAMIQNKVPTKLGDPGSFLIPCNFNKTFSCNALADLGASINLMSYSLYVKLSLENLKPTKMSVRLADRSFQYPNGIAKNMLIEVGKFTYPADFVILEMEEDSKVPLILEEIFAKFNEFMAMTADENSDSESDTEALPFKKININTDYKIKTSLEEPPTDLELKPLPDNLEYHKEAFAWKTTDIHGICPSFCKHKIQLLDNKKPVVQKQRRMNPNMQEVVKKEIVKLLDTDFSKIARPITKLLEKDTPFEFNDECQKAFELLKEKLTCAPVIVSPNWNLPFELMCDASDFTVGAVLGQKDEIKGRKGTEIVAADHLFRIEKKGQSSDGQLAKLLVGDVIPNGMTYQQKNKFFSNLKHYFWEEPYLFKVCSGGFYWPTIIKEAHTLVRLCEACQKTGNISKRDEMPLNNIQALPTFDAGVVILFLKKPFFRFGMPKALISDRVENTNKALKRILEKTVKDNPAIWSRKLDDALWAFHTAYKTPTGTTPYKLIYGKNCHLPFEIEHRAYWALKNCNPDLIAAVHDLGSVETEFPTIVFNDTLTSEATLSCEPTVSSLNDNKIFFRISFDESDDEDCTVIFYKNSFSYKIISVNNLKTDLENDNDKANMPLLPSPKPTVSYFDDLDFFKDFENEFPAIVYNDAQTSKSDLLTEPILNPQHTDEFNLKDETSLSKCDEEEQNVLYFT
ncbi:reverse transcriptase domain-containing protein [Tanacetum coccineum]